MIKKISYFYLFFTIHLHYCASQKLVSPSYAPTSPSRRSSDLESLASTILISRSSSPQNSPEPEEQSYKVFPQFSDDQIPCWPQERVIELFKHQVSNDISSTLKTLLKITGHTFENFIARTRHLTLMMNEIPNSPDKKLTAIHSRLQAFGVENIAIDQSDQDNSQNPDIQMSLFKSSITFFPAFTKSSPDVQQAALLYIAQHYKNDDFVHAHVINKMIEEEKENPINQEAAKIQYETYLNLCQLRASIQSLGITLTDPALQSLIEILWQTAYDQNPEECHEALDEFRAYLENSKHYQPVGEKRKR